ncbi:alpha/beta hydrolase [Tsukamurella pseudospumae]|uniref:Esterase n=1 Tax=Tsukamurella pseudospumae TaxID=239498 RepID=A0A138AVG7_9ACTN|nr:alpha/beta hydrolase-fold protein [Tsukamurella pseudospumae]KXP14414.1 hypothetical protein AXK60_00430 [Tsukamurella pseudospumae]
MDHRGGVSLLTGWLPLSVFALAAVAAAVVLLGHGRWLRIGLPVCLALGALAAWGADAEMGAQGLAGEPAPVMLWVWLGLTVATLIAAIVRFRSGRPRGRIVSMLAVPLLLIAALLVVNQWVGYYRTVQVAWSALTAGPLPNQTSQGDLPGLRDTVQKQGRVVPVDIPDDASGFAHRTEYVYLPPAWFAGKTPPALPAVEMIGGEFNTPADWIRLGSATQVADQYAAQHGGRAPILVFVDSGGSFNNDTECVDGPRGDSASHLTKDVRPYVISTFGAASDAAHWGVIGWSMGGTCAVDLTVVHPELFSAFGDIGGDLRPNAGNQAQTVSRLFGGDASKWDAYDPQTVMAQHGAYRGVAGIFVDAAGHPQRPGGKPRRGGGQHPAGQWGGQGGGAGGRGYEPDPYSAGASQTLCTAMTKVDIACTVQASSHGHTWESATQALTPVLATVAGHLTGTPSPSAPAPAPAAH